MIVFIGTESRNHTVNVLRETADSRCRRGPVHYRGMGPRCNRCFGRPHQRSHRRMARMRRSHRPMRGRSKRTAEMRRVGKGTGLLKKSAGLRRVVLASLGRSQPPRSPRAARKRSVLVNISGRNGTTLPDRVAWRNSPATLMHIPPRFACPLSCLSSP